MILNNLPFFIAYHFRQGRRSSGMLSMISLISTLSIALGVAVLIIGLSAMNGFERELKNRILSVIPHGEIYSNNGSFANWQSAMAILQQAPHVVSVAPYITITGLIESKDKLQALQIRGVDPGLEKQNSRLPDYIEQGVWSDFKAGYQQLIIGKGMASTLAVNIGDWVTIIIPRANKDNGKLQQPKRIRLQISSILDLSGDLGYKLAFVPLTDAQQYADLADRISGIMINVDNEFEARPIIYNAGLSLTDRHYRMRSWEFTYGYLYRDIQLIRTIMYLAMILVISVACFNIVSTLIIAVKDKSTDIAVLRTLGANDQLIRRIFICYGLLAGIAGSFIGVVLGMIVSLNLSAIVGFIEKLIGYRFLASNIYFIDFIPTELHLRDIVIVLITSIILSLFASWYPSRRACKVEPAKVLNGI